MPTEVIAPIKLASMLETRPTIIVFSNAVIISGSENISMYKSKLKPFQEPIVFEVVNE
jgi:hypothetical protein